MLCATDVFKYLDSYVRYWRGKDFFVTPTYVLLTYVAGSPSTGKDIVPRAHTSHKYVAGSPSTGDKVLTHLTPAVLQGMRRYMGFLSQ
jgi:hypothetical protein